MRLRVETDFILINGLVDLDSIFSYIYKDFLPQELEQDPLYQHLLRILLSEVWTRFKTLSVQRMGVQGKKLVVRL